MCVAMKQGSLILAVVLLAIVGCSRKEEPPAKSPAELAKSAVTIRALTLKPGIEFYDAAKQQRYESLFQHYLDQFESPAVGSSLWLKRWDGHLAGGTVTEVLRDGVTINCEGQLTTIKITDMSPESRAQIFAGEFARANAMGRLTGELKEPQTSSIAIESRYPICDDIEPRVGPGLAYRRIGSVLFGLGKPVNVIAELDGWVRVQSDATTNACWLPRFMTHPLDELNRSALESDYALLTKAGLVKSIDPESNMADVDMTIWRGTDHRERLGVARALADYCAVVRSNNLAFVTIRDGQTQKKLGKYSHGHGWKETAL